LGGEKKGAVSALKKVKKTIQLRVGRENAKLLKKRKKEKGAIH